MLLVLAAGTECNAVSYWIEQGNILFNQGNYQGATNCYDKAIALGNQTNAPIFTEIVTQCEYRMDAFDTNSRIHFSKICAEPTRVTKNDPNSSPENFTLSFDVSNPNCMHMRIGNIYVNVTKYNNIHNTNVIQNFAQGHNRGYSCNIKPIVGMYKCILKSKNYDFIDLAPNELEHIVINIDTDTPGIYGLRIGLDYAIGSDSNRIAVGEVPEIIGYFDNSLISEAG
jgi:hypothetical protein